MKKLFYTKILFIIFIFVISALFLTNNSNAVRYNIETQLKMYIDKQPAKKIDLEGVVCKDAVSIFNRAFFLCVESLQKPKEEHFTQFDILGQANQKTSNVRVLSLPNKESKIVTELVNLHEVLFRRTLDETTPEEFNANLVLAYSVCQFYGITVDQLANVINKQTCLCSKKNKEIINLFNHGLEMIKNKFGTLEFCNQNTPSFPAISENTI